MANRKCRKITACRACKSKRLSCVADFGKTPPANSFLKNLSLKTVKNELWFPLRLMYCQNCSLVQLEHVVNPKILFENYVYVSSTSKVFVKHFEEFASSLVKRFELNKNSLAVDIGSNDGILLKPFKNKGVKVLGIEPAVNIAKRANKFGIKTISKFFSENLAKKLVREFGNADVVTATNVFAHVDDLDDLVAGVKELLKDEGVFIIEVPYLGDFLKKNLFDTVYHEHLSYFSVSSLKVLFERLQMKIIDVKKVASHGGSIRIFMQKQLACGKVSANVYAYLQKEKQLKLNKVSTYKQFFKRVTTNKKRLTELLARLKKTGNKIAAYGAPAKGNTLLNYFKINQKQLDYIVDDSPYKQNLYTPGTHVKVVSSKALYSTPVDYVLILAWNFADSIIKMHRQYKKRGGKYIIPVPAPKVI